jgi:hypothetical protein
MPASAISIDPKVNAAYIKEAARKLFANDDFETPWSVTDRKIFQEEGRSHNALYASA